MQIHAHVADDSLSDDQSIILESFITDHLHDIFGDLIEIEMFPRADETKVIVFPGESGLTLCAANILSANAAETIDKEIEKEALPYYEVTTTQYQYSEFGEPPPKPVASTEVMHYRQVLERWPWMLAILPATQEEASHFSLRWVSGMTEIKIH